MQKRKVFAMGLNENFKHAKAYQTDALPGRMARVTHPSDTETPKDWDGRMGVPITFLKYYNPDQFEILGLTRDMDLPGKTGMPEGFVRDYFAQGNHSGIRPGHPDVCYYDAKGRCQVPYRRIVIQKRPEFS